MVEWAGGAFVHTPVARAAGGLHEDGGEGADGGHSLLVDVEDRHGMIASARPGPEIRVRGGQFDHGISVKEPTFAMFV